MTREEAIEMLRGARITSFRPNGTALVKEALNMAISALTDQKDANVPTNEDLVQRSDVLELAKSGKIISNDNYEKTVKLINSLPSCHRCYECDEDLLTHEEAWSATNHENVLNCGEQNHENVRNGRNEDANDSDLISRDKLLSKLKRRKKFFIDAWGSFHLLSITDRSRVDELDACIAEVINMPTVAEKHQLSEETPIMEIDTSTDLISREDAVEAVCGGCSIETKNNCKEEGDCYEVQNLKALPSAEPKRGEWKPIELNGYPYMTCDQCGLLADMVSKDGEFVMSMANADEAYARFCPNCGAKMGVKE